jgi:hypothetical protein
MIYLKFLAMAFFVLMVLLFILSDSLGKFDKIRERVKVWRLRR